jgi:phosphotransferase system enzyme I (PtsP)
MNTDHIKMLCDISELNSLFEGTSIEQFLQKTVDMVADHMNAGVCSIYIYDEPGKKLVLKANKGLNPSAVNGISMDLGEGLVGIAMKEARVINEKIGKNHPGFKFYPGSGEEDYSAFLAVPIMRGIVKIGVLVVQRGEGSHFDDRDIIAMRPRHHSWLRFLNTSSS